MDTMEMTAAVFDDPTPLKTDHFTVVESNGPQALVAVHRERNNAGRTERFDFRIFITPEDMLAKYCNTFPFKEGQKLGYTHGKFHPL